MDGHEYDRLDFRVGRQTVNVQDQLVGLEVRPEDELPCVDHVAVLSVSQSRDHVGNQLRAQLASSRLRVCAFWVSLRHGPQQHQNYHSQLIIMDAADAEAESNEFLESNDGNEAADRVSCEVCSRKFNGDRIDRHLQACRKAQAKQKERERIKRRKQGTTKEQPDEDKKPTKWREQHKNFLEIVKYNRKLKEVEQAGGDVAAVQAPAQQIPSDYVYCPGCQRNFDPLVAERHLPKCREIISKPKPPMQSKRRTQQQWATKYPQKQMAMTRAPEEGWSNLENGSAGKTQQPTKSKPPQNSKNSTASLNESDDSKMMTQTTMNSHLRAQSTQKKKPPKNIAVVSENAPSIMMKTTQEGLPELKNTKYNGNWTKIGFADLQARATLISDTVCPHCSRKFVHRAAERHIPICEKLMQKVTLNIVTKSSSVPRSKRALPPRSQGSEVVTPKGLPQPKTKLATYTAVKEMTDTFAMGMSMAKFCGFCGIKFQMGHKYCGGCGKKRESAKL